MKRILFYVVVIGGHHHCIHAGVTRTLEAARELLEREGIMGDPNFRAAIGFLPFTNGRASD